MIRFRNPGSSLDTLIAIFKQLYVELNGEDFFDNTDIAKILSKANLMASSGYTGDMAIELGSNVNKSRDKTYNNAKMYAEIFRLLGLISTVNNASSNYRFTFVGEHLVVPGADTKALIKQCVLGMNNPNRIMDVSYTESVRFFSCVLLAMSELDEMICRDEMILGPMNVNDNSSSAFSDMIKLIKGYRSKKSLSNLETELKKLAKTQTDNKKEGMTVVSVRNCTRFPISVLKYCGWVEDYTSNEYGKKVKFMKLTESGKDVVSRLRAVKDIRLEDYEKLPSNKQKALIRLGTYQLLGRAKFDLKEVENEISSDEKECFDITGGKEILFSAFQTLDLFTVNSALNVEVEVETTKNRIGTVIQTYEKRVREIKSVEIDSDVVINGELMTSDMTAFVEYTKILNSKMGNVDKVIEYIVKEHESDNKTTFYPFIETLFKIIGVDCHKSRDGVNGERWDAMIRDKERSIPIEIKSPGEEMNISIKAIRQALENKIILLSRRTYITDEKTVSLAVGYNPPNNRAEVSELIDNIKNTYGYNIAVLDIHSLVRLAVNIIVNNKGIDIEKIYELEGIVDVKDIEG